MFVDSHCHLNFEDFGHDIDKVLAAAEQEGIHTFLNISCRLGEIPPILALSEQHSSIYATVGIHPHEAEATLDLISPDSIDARLRPYATEHFRVIGIGETGLDFYYNHSSKVAQEKAFHQQIALAIDVDLPLIVHTRDAEKETIDILSQYKDKARGVIHCFSGSQWLADAALDLGFYISFSGIVTFPKADELRTTAQGIPLDRILLETDAPFLAPVPKRGKRNEPAFMVHTAATIAGLQNVTIEEVAHHTTENFYRLFTKAQKNL